MATIYITSNASSGTGTLRQAILDANAGDVITPAPALEGTTIILAAVLNVSKPVTIEGGRKRLTIDGGGSYYVYFNATAGDDEETIVRDVDFVNLKNTTTAGAGSVRVNTARLTLERVLVAGCETKNGGAFHLGLNVESFVAVDCAALGNLATTSSGVAYFSSGKEELSYFTNCTMVGNIPSELWNATPATDSCKTDTTGLVSPPPSTWDASTWTSTGWQSWNVHILPSSTESFGSSWGDVDLEGVPRINGTKGAYETIIADLYWIGLDGTGQPVASPSLTSADGWASDRWATSSGTTVPNDVLSLFVGSEDVSFSGTWAPDDECWFYLGRGNVFATFDESRVHVGTGTLSFSGKIKPVAAAYAHEYIDVAHFAPVAPATLDASSIVLRGSLTVSTGVTAIIELATLDLTVTGGNVVVGIELRTPSFTFSSGEITFEQDAVLVADAATITGGTFTAEVAPRGYVSLPSSVSATLEGVTRLYTDANASNFRADTTGSTVSFSWDGGATCLEKVEPFEQLATNVASSDAPTTNVYVQTVFRLWSGNEWLHATATPRVVAPYWTVEKWGIVRAEVDDVAFTVQTWGLSPDVVHEGE